jgi:hypothetical protein
LTAPAFDAILEIAVGPWEAAMPAKPKNKAKFTFEETEFGFEIGLKSGAHRRVMLFCKVGEGFTEFPAGTALLSQMLGGDKVAAFGAPIPLDALWRDLASARQPNTPKLKPDILRYSPEYVYWLHPADYDAAMRLFAD